MSMVSHRAQVKAKLEWDLARGLDAVGVQAVYNADHVEAEALIYSRPPPKDYIRTGHYRQSISYKVQGKKVYVGARIEYSKCIEYGTIYMPARPVIQNAARNYLSQYQRILEDCLNL